MEGDFNLALLAYRLVWGAIAAVLATTISLRVSCRVYNKLFTRTSIRSIRRSMPRTIDAASWEPAPTKEESPESPQVAGNQDLVPVEVVDDGPTSRRAEEQPDDGGVPVPSMGRSLLIALVIVLGVGAVLLLSELACYGLVTWADSFRPDQYGRSNPHAPHHELVRLIALAASSAVVLLGLLGCLVTPAGILVAMLRVPFWRAVGLSSFMLVVFFVIMFVGLVLFACLAVGVGVGAAIPIL